MAKLLVLTAVFLFALMSACGIPVARSDLPLGALARKCPPGELARAERLAIEARLSARYGMSIKAAESACRESAVACQAIEKNQGKTLALLYDLIDSEFARYPVGFLRDHGPREIWLANDLVSRSRPSGLAGLALSDSRVVYLSVPDICSDEGFRHTVQHEVFHVLDPQVIAAFDRADDWNALNPPGFRYEGFDEHKNGRGVERPAGFASAYSQVSQFEDRAEVYAFGVVSPWVNEHKQIANNDKILSDKRRTLSQWMTERWPELGPFLSDLSSY